ncbi:MAG TPA: hypothetical protein PLL10_06700, partial [Elusimicrobiales bacterium]|nr:hypothetical protein [Elusimicrobiales bacterium]
FELNLPPRWDSREHDDPEILLHLTAGEASFSLSELREAPDASLLRTRLQNELMALRAKGYAVPDHPAEADNHRGGRLVYALYRAGTTQITAGFLIFEGRTLALSAVDMPEAELLSALQTLKSPGESAPTESTAKTTFVRRKRLSVAASRKTAPRPAPEETPSAAEVSYILENAASSDISSTTSPSNGTFAANELPLPAVSTAIPRPPDQPPLPAPTPPEPLYPREPIPLPLLGLAALLWGAGAVYASHRTKKLPPLFSEQAPPDLPPDYNFPYKITATATVSTLQFSFAGRDNLLLNARLSCLPEKLCIYALYSLVGFEFAWSCLDLIGLNLTAALLSLPGGKFLALIPEIVFLAVIGAGLTLRQKDDRKLQILDSNDAEIFHLTGDESNAAMEDARGKDLGRLSKTSPGYWTFYNDRNLPIFELHEKDSTGRQLRKILGSLGGLLSPRYEIFVKGQPAGSAARDTDGSNSFDLNLSFNLYESVPKECLLASLLYVKALEHDCWFL